MRPSEADFEYYDPNETKSGGDCPAVTCSPKIIQILIAPNDALWQGMILGLGDDGVTYRAGSKNTWEPLIPPVGFYENAGDDSARSD